MKIIAKGSQNGAEIDAKTHQKSMPELVSKKRWKNETPGTICRSHFGTISTKKLINKSMQKPMLKKHEDNYKRLPKWSWNRCQNASKINARKGIEQDQGNHQKSCFSEEWNHWNSLETNGFWGFRKLHVQMVKVPKKHQKWDQNPSEIQWQIDTKNMLQKREPKYENSSKKWSKNGATIHQKAFQKRCEKRDKKKRSKNTTTSDRHGAEFRQTQSFQKTSFGVRCNK